MDYYTYTWKSIKQITDRRKTSKTPFSDINSKVCFLKNKTNVHSYAKIDIDITMILGDKLPLYSQRLEHN